MRGQSTIEMLILVGAILMVVTSMLYIGVGTSERSAVMRAARDGAENAIAAIDAKYGCSIDITGLGFDAGTISINVTVRNAPPENFTWDEFRENVVKILIRDMALKYIHNAVTGSFPVIANPVKTEYYTYDVPLENIDVRRLTK